jgi:hypothetical protein
MNFKIRSLNVKIFVITIKNNNNNRRMTLYSKKKGKDIPVIGRGGT